METIILGIIWYVSFLISITVHEAAHAFVGVKLGDNTAENQVTLDPTPHVRREPVGTILIPIISFFLTNFTWMFGWASAPFSLQWAWQYPKRKALVSLAGPVSNLILMFIAIILIHMGIFFEIFYEPTQIDFSDVVGVYAGGTFLGLGTFLSIMFSLNLILFIFNLLPLPPLDGSRLFPLFMDEEKALKIMDFLHQPGVGFIGLLLAWRLFGYVIRPIRLLIINYLLYPGSNFH